MLITIESVLDQNTVQQWRKQLINVQWQDGRDTAGSVARHVKQNQQLDNNHPLAVDLGKLILNKLAVHPVFVSAALPNRIFPPKFNRYENGGEYGIHVDGAIMNLPDHTSMRTDLSATLFLTDPDEYEGGELMIETQYGAQAVKLNAGDLVLYPSTSLHQVMPVTQGARISSFFWIESMVRDATEREMLFDLDQSIQALTVERSAKDSEVNRLNAIYHNLLRRWAL